MSSMKSLDLVFTIDCTASMSRYIVQAEQNISQIVNRISTSDDFQVRFGLVEYRDHPPQKQGFVTRTNGFTYSLPLMSKWLQRCAQIKDGVPADMCFVLDSSGSIGTEDFQKEKDFVNSVIDSLTISDDMVRVAVVTYSSKVETTMFLSSYSNRYELKSAVARIGYMGCLTDTGNALHAMQNVLTNSSHGSREMVQKLGIVITDGCSDNFQEVVRAVDRAKSSDIRMISVGVGSGVNEKELQEIASSPNFVYRVDNFDALSGIKNQIVSDAVQGINNGGDEPEAVEDGLYDTLHLDWQSDVRMCVLIADQPPHGLSDDRHDNFPRGCPDRKDPMEIAENLAEKGVSIYVVGCEPSISPYRDFFMALAKMTGGLYIPLSDSENLAQVIIGAAKEEISLRENMEIVEDMVKEERQNHGVVDEESVSKKLFEILKDKTTKQLQLNGGQLPEVSPRAKRFARFPTIADVKKKFKPSPKPSTSFRGHATFEVVEKPIDLLQVQRMVQKAIMIHQ